MLTFFLFTCKGFNPIKVVKCKFYECCEPPAVSLNITKLENKLEKHLYGQPLVVNTLLSALKAHFILKDPKKALVLSFHGSTGVGKFKKNFDKIFFFSINS